MDNYTAVYDAVRSRIQSVDLADAARRAFDISHQSRLALDEFSFAVRRVSEEMQRPSVVYKPTLFVDGAEWCALLGPDVQQGLAGFGTTPAEAMAAFDNAFFSEPPPKEACARCKGTGAVDTPYSGSDPVCPDCDGEGSPLASTPEPDQ